MDLFNNKKKNNKHPVLKQKLTFSQKASDIVTGFIGSWRFIIVLMVFIAVWMLINALVLIYEWDPYPFILLNFILSCLAAMQAPIILMSQNRQAQRDRIQAKYDYQVNRRAEREIQKLTKQITNFRKTFKTK